MKKAAFTALALMPALVSAQNLSNLQTFLNSVQTLVRLALPIVVGLALLGFFWGLVKFIFASGNEVNKDQGKNLMIYSVVALFVMVSVWGIVQFIGQAFNIEQGGQVNIPTVQGL